MTEHIKVKGGEFVEGSWKDFRDDVYAVEPELAKIIDQINPPDEYKLIRGTYLYGESITQLGKVCVPNTNGTLSPLNADDVSKKFRQQLGYCPTPLTLQLTKAAEVFISTGERIIPLNVFKPGDMYGLFEALVPYTGCQIVPCWSVVSGARSVFLVAKVSDKHGNKRLMKEFGIKTPYSGELTDQWRVFKHIVSYQKESQHWASQVLFFTDAWIQERNDSIEWLMFQKYLFKKAWQQSKNTRVKNEYAALWEAFAAVVSNRNYRPSAYDINTIMHCMFIGHGNMPGFRPIANPTDTLMPTTVVEAAYNNVYGALKDYPPIIMAPAILGVNEDYTPVYYSYNYPTLLEGSYNSNTRDQGTMMRIRSVIPLMNMLQDVVKKQKGEFYNQIKNIEFTYYHSKEDKYSEVLLSNELIVDDLNIAKCLERYPGKKFPVLGPFLRGCCRITLIGS